MKFEIVTIFPDFFRGPLDYGIVRRAREAGLIEISLHDLRAFTTDRHRTVDDRPFGGGEGMVLKPEPVFRCVESLGVPERSLRVRGEVAEAVILLSPQGQVFTQAVAQQLAALDRIVMICGRYEGVDERVAEALTDREISVGDYVLSGGELAAAAILDTVTRLVPERWAMKRPRGRRIFPKRRSLALKGRTARALPADCWTTRTTRGRLSFAVWRCRKCSWAATMSRSADGEGSGRSRRRCVIVRICCGNRF